ncbi:MAG: carboxypeptidase-like regulatory domain-containing protein [Pyrinomonadaceae bacterium]
MNTDEKIEEIARLMHRDDSIDAPPHSLKWAKNLIRSRIAEPKPSILRKITALLQIEISPGQTAFGERSASGSEVRQMLFDAGDNAIDLRIKKTGNNSGIQGQILGEGFEGARMTLENAANTFETIVDQEGSFRLEKVPDGTYRLVIKSTEAEIAVESIHFTQ